MRIKKSQRNEYIYADGVWVRNFAKRRVKEVSINKMHTENDFSLVVSNEMENVSIKQLSFINDETLNFPNVVIVSDGYDFENKQDILANLPKTVAVFAVNGALKKWKHNKNKHGINLYVANNPYKECLDDLPRHSYYPTCVASTRTHTGFIEKYIGNKFLYVPTPEETLGSFFSNGITWHVDDYRNPVCAAIALAHRFNVKKLLLCCCDCSFKDQRPAAEQLENGLWQYPQHQLSHSVIDANLYWLAKQGDVVIADHSSGKDYVNAQYIPVEGINSLFIG